MAIAVDARKKMKNAKLSAIGSRYLPILGSNTKAAKLAKISRIGFSAAIHFG